MPFFTEMNQSDGAYSRDGSKLAWVQDAQVLWIADADGQNKQKLADVTQEATFTGITNPRWSPDGMHIAYQILPIGHVEQAHIWVTDLSGNAVNLTSNAQADSPEWSPDGAKLVFESARTGDVDIFTMHADGSNQANLTLRTRDQQIPHWSPDGNSVVFYGPTNGTSSFAIWRMNSDGSQAQAITSTTSGVSDSDAHWVSNQQLVYTHFVSAQPSELYVTGPQGTNQHIFSPSTNSYGQRFPMPSPDGKYIAWSEQDSAQVDQIWISSVDTVVATRATNSSGLNNVALGWKPCP